MKTFKNQLADLVEYSSSWWSTLGIKVCDVVRKETISGKDVNGVPFKKYSSQEPFFFYNKKAKKVVRAQGYKQSKSEGKFRRQATQYKDKVNLILTGDMMLKGFKPQPPLKDGIKVGWASADNAQKIVWNEENGRYVRNDNAPFPFSKGAENVYDGLMLKDADKKVKKQNETIVLDCSK